MLYLGLFFIFVAVSYASTTFVYIILLSVGTFKKTLPHTSRYTAFFWQSFFTFFKKAHLWSTFLSLP
jgi:hypothetical protein